MSEVTRDPPPIPPEKPLPSDCCESGCERCVFNIHAEEIAHYDQALAAWQACKSSESAGAAGDDDA